MKTRPSYTLQFAIFGAALLLAPVLRGATLPPQIKQQRSAQQAKPAAATPASAQLQFVTIDAPDALLTAGYGVNNTGLVSGYYQDASFNLHGFLWLNGTLKTQDYPGATDTLLGDSSEAGLVIGNYGDAITEHVVLYDLGHARWTTLPDIPNQPLNFGDGINNPGVGTGSACQGNMTVGPVLNCAGWTWDGNEYSLFSAPGADQTVLGTFSNGINDRGQVVGYFTDSSGVYHGFLKEGNNFITIDVPGAGTSSGDGTLPYDINDSQEIVGFYYDASGVAHGFTEQYGSVTTLDVPGAVATLIFGNDDRGGLAGQWQDSTGTYHGFVAFKH